MKKETTYYLLWNRVLGKQDGNGDFLYKDGEWVPDDDHRIQDRLVGFDSTEPEGSPYSFMNMSIMDEIEEITEQDANDFLTKEKEERR